MTRNTTESPASMTDDERWQAVAARDASRDGCFVYAVTRTGIYCRPDCPSRTPGRAGTRFFADPAQAEAAGYRPCKRCRPEAAASPAEARRELVLAACRRIEAAAEAGEETPALHALASGAGLSRAHFQKLFTARLGVSPKAYAQACKARRLREALASGEPVTQAVYAAGYGSASRVYENAGALLGMTPGSFAGGGPNEAIRLALAATSLGPLLVAATARGVCLIEFGDNETTLLELARRRFPAAEVSDDPELAGWLALVVAAVERSTPLDGLPLDVRGTAFRQRVWQELRRIPPGATLSYSELAARLGRPEAVRAVAGACAANPAAIAVPCHRIVGKDGALTGYRWGLARKRELLEREKRAAGDEWAPDWQI